MSAAPELHPVTDRDYVAEMRAVVDAETAEGPYVSREVASRVVAKLRVTDSALLYGWLDAQAEGFLWQAINDRDRSTRARAVASAGRSAFGAASEKFQSGDKAALSQFLAMPFVVEDGSRKRLADMTAGDLHFTADAYERRAAKNAMYGAFLRSVAKKVKGGCVADHFAEQQLSDMWQSLAA